MDKEKIGGVAETMLQTLYARAKESGKTNHKIFDAKAIEIVEQMDYDFSAANKDAVMTNGVVARTIVLDQMVNDYIVKHPETTVVNVACGMDTRFYRVDNGKISWYNIDLPETMDVREKYIQECDRVHNIASSAMDASWTDQIPVGINTALIIVEGLSMYLAADDVKQIFAIISRRFSHATVFMEILNPVFIKKNVEKSISQSGAVFIWGAKSGEELMCLADAFRWQGDRSLVEGIIEIAPIYKVVGKIGIIRSLSNKIAILKK